MRELHWQDDGEWALMLPGKARITALDDGGKGYVKDAVFFNGGKARTADF